MARSEQLGQQRDIALSQGTIRYRERGSGAPVVFFRGLLVNGDLWRKVVPTIADARVTLVDDSYTFISEDRPDALSEALLEFLEEHVNADASPDLASSSES